MTCLYTYLHNEYKQLDVKTFNSLKMFPKEAIACFCGLIAALSTKFLILSRKIHARDLIHMQRNHINNVTIVWIHPIAVAFVKCSVNKTMYK